MHSMDILELGHEKIKYTRRNFIKTIGILSLLPAQAKAAFSIIQTHSTGAILPSSQWYNLPVGGGGNESKLAISPNGFYRIDNFDSTNIGATVNTQIGTYPVDRMDYPVDMAPSMDHWDMLVVAYSNSGWAFRGYTGLWP
jgi:hypothetical protein